MYEIVDIMSIWKISFLFLALIHTSIFFSNKSMETQFLCHTMWRDYIKFSVRMSKTATKKVSQNYNSFIIWYTVLITLAKLKTSCSRLVSAMASESYLEHNCLVWSFYSVICYDDGIYQSIKYHACQNKNNNL